MFKIFIFCFLAGPGPIYSFSFNDWQGNVMHFSDFKGKKILIVNTASASKHASQYAGLEQLYQKYKDSLVIIAFPSNDFGHEGGGDSTIRQSLVSRFGIHYILASKISVLGSKQQDVFQWLTKQSSNGHDENPVSNDFYKFLIDSNGNWMGVFSDDVDPMDLQIQNAIRL